MNVKVTFRGMKSSDAIREYIEEKSQKISKYLRDPIDVNVICEVEKIRHKVEMTITSHRDTFKGTETSDDMYASTDTLLDKLETQMRRKKDKKVSLSRQKARTSVQEV